MNDGDGKTLIVTGASRGLGGHIAAQASAAGYRVVGLARHDAKGGCDFELRTCDVTDEAAVADTLSDLRRDETLYGLINAAGIAAMNMAVMTPAATAQRVVDVNLMGTIHCSRLVATWLMKRKRGRIVNFSSIAVPLSLKGEAAYVAAKAGVEGYSKVLARELAEFGITVNVVAPGPVETRLIAKVPPENIEALVARQVIPRMATGDDVWDAVSLLLRPEARMISGLVLPVGGA